jgi:uncharacterized protein YjbI with pentapeptide repeats
MSQDFKHQKLQGKSFRGQDLTSADFSHTDIRGVDFTKAILTNANFSFAKAGQQTRWIVIILLGLLVLTMLSGLISGFAGGLVGHSILIKENSNSFKSTIFFVISGILSLVVLVVFSWTVVRKGLGSAFGTLALIVAIAVGIASVLGRAESEALVGTIIQFLVLATAISGAIIGSIAVSTIFMLIGTKAIVLTGLVFLLSAIPGALEGSELGKLAISSKLVALIIAGSVAFGMLSLSIYIGWKAAINSDDRYLIIYKISTILSSLGGTSFRRADLTDSDFSDAILKSVDLRAATLKRTCWFQSKQLDHARLEGTYLKDKSIRHLVVTKDGRDKDYSYLNLRGINLQNARLSNIGLIGADLSESNLREADFSKAKLAKTQLYGADLTGSCLTGAFIQDWAIATDTKLDEVKCEYIYMRLPTQDNPAPWRKPDNLNETFKEGDFTDFIAPIIKTLDLYRQQNIDPRQIASTFKSLDFYHYGGIDPAASAIAIQQLSEENPEAGLEVVTLEGRGSEKIRLQAVVTGNANSSQLNAKYFEKYREISSLPYSDIQSLLAGAAEKDERIRSLEKLLGDALQQPKFYVETYQNQGEFIMTQQNKGNVNISGVQGNISGIAASGENQTMTGVALGAISGNVTNTISQLPDPTDSNEPSLKELLTQLQALIESESELNEEDKVEALEQVKVLAESGQKPEDSTLQKLAKTAVKILKGTISSLPDVTKLVESGAKLLPYITKLLGLP